MKEKVLIKGKFSKANKLLYILIGLAALFLIIAIGCSDGDFLEILNEFDSDYLMIVHFPFLLSIVCFILAIVSYFIMNNCEITVTDKRVYGKIKFGTRVDLPINQISSVGQGLFNSLAVSTSSGIIKFWLLENRTDVFNEITNLLSKNQGNKDQTIVQNTVPQSNADELKKYKDLLDSGVITQEEFDAKKKQILSL